jgi:hypothetical protein
MTPETADDKAREIACMSVAIERTTHDRRRHDGDNHAIDLIDILRRAA